MSIDSVRVVTGDTDNTPYGGGTWASRAAGIGGEAAWQAGKALRGNVLAVAGSDAAGQARDLDIRNGVVVDRRRAAPSGCRSRSWRASPISAPTRCPPASRPNWSPRAITCRAPGPSPSPTASRRRYLEVDTDTGFVKLLKHWCVEDCGTIINPQLVDEQIRGGVVQGIGAALFEQCLYDERGQMLNGNMADYLVPMAAEMPDIECGHVVSPTAD